MVRKKGQLMVIILYQNFLKTLYFSTISDRVPLENVKECEMSKSALNVKNIVFCER